MASSALCALNSVRRCSSQASFSLFSSVVSNVCCGMVVSLLCRLNFHQVSPRNQQVEGVKTRFTDLVQSAIERRSREHLSCIGLKWARMVRSTNYIGSVEMVRTDQ